MKKYFIITIIIVAISIITWRYIQISSNQERYSQTAFEDWQNGDIKRQQEFAAFTDYLKAKKLDNIIPIWQLMRTDIALKSKCKRPAFIIPPRKTWPNIVPTLRLIKKEIIPALGKVEVYSSYRTAAFNDCVGGASKSQHLRFSGLDLVAHDMDDRMELFRTLCALHRKIGPSEKFGLGAYFDPRKPNSNRIARFHVDAAGFRSWGFSKKSASSGCQLLS